jgi:hypothetical protein
MSDAPLRNGGVSPFDAAQTAWLDQLLQRVNARAAVYEPARVRDSRVSVLMPSAGAPKPLLDALDSLVAQRMPNWEAIVVDCAGIETEAMLRAHPAWKQTSYVRLPAAATPGAARNLALRMARGEYVAFLDPDNRFAPEHLERAVDTIARTGAMAAFSRSRLVVERTDNVASSAQAVAEAPYGGDPADLERLAVAHAIPLDAFVVYRGAFARTGTFHETVPFLEDWHFALTLACAAGCAPTGAVSVDVVARLGLAVQRLGSTYPAYLTVMDALYAAHPADAVVAGERARHRAALAEAIGAAPDWIREPHGVIAFMTALAGRHGRIGARAAQPA